MLDNVEKSKLAHAMMATPSTTFPHPISKHLGKLSEQELQVIKRHAAQNLVKMHYAKQLEDIIELYDCYDINDSKIIEKSMQKYKPNDNLYPGILAPFAVAGFLLYKRLPLLNFSSYLNNIYAVSYITLLSYSFAKYSFSLNKFKFDAEVFCDSNIIHTRNLVHSYNTNLINNLRFNANEAH
jgi:hypothetical protein